MRKAFKKGSEDNLTAMVIEFPWQGTYFLGPAPLYGAPLASCLLIRLRPILNAHGLDGLDFDKHLRVAKEVEDKKAEEYAAAKAKADATADDNIFG